MLNNEKKILSSFFNFAKTLLGFYVSKIRELYACLVCCFWILHWAFEKQNIISNFMFFFNFSWLWQFIGYQSQCNFLSFQIFSILNRNKIKSLNVAKFYSKYFIYISEDFLSIQFSKILKIWSNNRIKFVYWVI